MDIPHPTCTDELLGLLTRRHQAKGQQMQIQSLFTGHFVIKAEEKTEQKPGFLPERR